MNANIRRILTAAITGLIVVMVTVFLFFMKISKPADNQWVSFGFLLFGELVATGGFIGVELAAEHFGETMSRVGAYSLLSVYFILEFIISIVFLGGGSIKTLVTTQIVLFAITAGILIILGAGSKSVKEKSTAQLTTLELFRQVAKRVLSIRTTNVSLEKSLMKIAEAIQYSDCSTPAPSDTLIFDRIDVLEKLLNGTENSEGRDQKAAVLCNDILLLIRKREMELKAQKTGEI